MQVNHFPGAFNLGRKDKLWTNISHHMQRFPMHGFDIMPKTYILPRDAKLLKEKMCSDGQLVPVILKPVPFANFLKCWSELSVKFQPASARGAGVKVVHRYSQIPRKVPLVVQT